jgi:hypothetical protein
MDFVLVAREEGPSLVQSFHKSLAQRGGFLNRILEDICAMANTNGGTVYVGMSADPKEPVAGVREPGKAIEMIESIISKRVTPTPEITVDRLTTQGKTVVRIIVRPGNEVPYAIDDNRFYIRSEAETTVAVRDEIVRLVERALGDGLPVREEISQPREPEPQPVPATKAKIKKTPARTPVAPSTGVEIVASEERDGVQYHTLRDLRNGNLIKNVTRKSARKLWHYAILQAEKGQPEQGKIDWTGNIAILDRRSRDNYVWYDLAMKDDRGIHIYYGVTDSGLNEEWLGLVN